MGAAARAKAPLGSVEASEGLAIVGLVFECTRRKGCETQNKDMNKNV